MSKPNYTKAATRLEELLYVRALEDPHAPAIEDDDGIIDYQTTWKSAQAISGAILKVVAEHGKPLHQNFRVGLAVQRGATAIVSLCGILLAGCCYVPLTLDAGAERLQSTIDAAGIEIILTDSDSIEALNDKLDCISPCSGPMLVNVQSLCAGAVRQEVFPDRGINALESNTAYVLFSSGTTGKPKGIMMSHSAVLQYLDASKVILKPSRRDRWLHAASYSFDVSLEEIFVPLSVGACIVCQPQKGLDTLSGYLHFLRASRITAISMPTALWHRLSAHLVDGEDTLPSCLRLVVIGGEAARSEAYQQWSSVARGRVELVNAYGPTECCISATFGTHFDPDSNVLSIGRPLPGIKAYVAGLHSDIIVPDGEIGRLLLSGPQLAQGYLGDESLTALKFLANPFEESARPPYERVYDTGDLVFRAPTGELNFCGRVDLQLQVRGQRVEAEGVESILASHPHVAEAAIIVVEEQGTEAMVAFLVLHGGHTEDSTRRGIGQRCDAHLMPFEKPSYFVFLDELPLTTNGKVDRNALHVEWAHRRGDAGSGFPLPLSTDTEHALAALWNEVLSLGQPVQLGKESKLIELGGHSLTFVTLTSKIYKSLKLKVTVTELMRHNALSDMAAFLEGLSLGSTESPDSHPECGCADDGDGLYDLTEPQEHLFLAQSKEPDSPFFNDGVAIEITGEYDPSLLERSIQRVVRRHEALRCVLVRTDNDAKVQQRLVPWSEHLWEALWHYRTVQADDLEEASARIFSIPLDLFQGPLIKFHLLKAEGPSAERRSVLIVQAHHICWDGLSDCVFLEELITFYKDEDAVLESPATLKATLEYHSRASDASVKEMGEYLRNVPEAVDLPTDLAPPPKKSYSRGGLLRFEWDSGLVRQATTATGRNIMPTSLALTVFATVLRRFAGGQSDFALGVPMANRVTPEVAANIGFFVNLLPLRVQAEDEHRLSDVLEMLGTGLQTLLRNQDVDLADVYRRQGGSSSSHERLLRFCFSFQDSPEGKLSDVCTFKRWPLHNGAARADLTCFTELNADGSISGELEYDADLFERGTMASMVSCMDRVLQDSALPQAWERTLGDLLMVEAQAEDGLQVTGNEHEPWTSLGTYLFQAIESYPQNIAIIDENSGLRITYDELAQSAKLLAHRIRDCAQGTGAVLMILERSWEIPVCQIASAIAGRPWICCDVGQPRERIMCIIDEAEPSCIIAQPKIAADLEIPVFPVPLLCASETLSGTSDTACGVTPATNRSNAAYIIYTSGTTGKPKGVAIEQHSFVSFLNHLRSWVTVPGAPASLSSILTSNPAFDGSLSQIYAALTTGGRLVIAKHGGEQDGEHIAEIMDEFAVNYLCTTTAAVRLWMTQAEKSYPWFFGANFRYLLLGGDELPPRFVADIFSRSRSPAEMEVKNVYGPTEGTIFSSYGTYRQSDLCWLEGRRRSPIDTILPSAAISIVGPNLRNLAVGAVGEIIIWGSCLAREYVGLPDLNAEKFITRDNGGLRGWKTGDLGRRTTSGAFEVLGRVDSMRKVLGGFRVDLDEVRLAVLSHDMVRECHISTFEDNKDGAKENKIVAHLVLQPSKSSSLDERDLETVASWKTMFTGVNQSLDEYNEDIDLGFDYRGWASSFDRSNISKDHMKEWVDCTLDRILDQGCFREGKKPRVAEIGCGTGMILFRLADKVSSYYGTDLATSTVAQVKRHAQVLGYDHVRTIALSAHDFDSALGHEEEFDLIICNSVAQYFPSLAYLDEVIHRARNRLAPGGSLFMGDIRHGGLKIHHAAMSAFFRGANTVIELQKSAVEILAQDQELLVDPSYFVDKCVGANRVFQGDARIELRRGEASTEMTLFRYDAVLMTEEQDIPPARVRTIQWGHQEDGLHVTSSPILSPIRPGADADVLVIQGVPNKRLVTAERLRCLLKAGYESDPNCLVSTMLEASAAQAGWDPEAALSQLQIEGYQGIILPSRQSPVSFDLIVAPPSLRDAAWHRGFVCLSATSPYPTAQTHLCEREPMLSPDKSSLFLHLFHKVPRYMIPHYVIPIKSLPLAGTGKVNSRLLPKPQAEDLFGGTSVQAKHSRDEDDALSSENEPLARKIADIFTEVLGKPKEQACSIRDDFFFSGGHSIVAARAIQIIRKRLGLDVPFTAILAHPTPVSLAARLAEIEKSQQQIRNLPTPMMLLQPSATNEPSRDIIVLPPVGGGLLPMTRLVSTISGHFQDARFVGIPWSCEHAGQAQTIEDLAQSYAGIISEFLQAATPNSKLYVLGWSFGGTLAYETCKRLQVDERSVQVLLVDSPTAEAAVHNIDPRTLAAENYAEQVVEYVTARSKRTREDYQEEGHSHRAAQSLTKAFMERDVDEKTDLWCLPLLVRQVIRIPAWVSDTDLVEAMRGLQNNLQALYGSYRQKERKSILVPTGMKMSVLQVQASRGLCTRLTLPNLGWDEELAHQAGRVDWVKYVVPSGHDDLLDSSINLVADLIASATDIL